MAYLAYTLLVKIPDDEDPVEYSSKLLGNVPVGATEWADFLSDEDMNAESVHNVFVAGALAQKRAFTT